MARVMSPQREKEFTELDGFLRFYLVQIKGLSETLFDEGAAEIALKYGRSKALDGLRQAVNDTVEDLSAASPEAIRLLDQALAEKGLVSFSSLRRRYSSQYKRVLKRGAITNETEFYLLSGIVSDLSTDISDEERRQLQEVLEAYERAA